MFVCGTRVRSHTRARAYARTHTHAHTRARARAHTHTHTTRVPPAHNTAYPPRADTPGAHTPAHTTSRDQQSLRNMACAHSVTGQLTAYPAS